jgi:oxaloacetate decarboxylase beta subunit
MENVNILDIFQGVATLADSETSIMVMRVFLIALGCLLIYLGKKGILEALLMIPMGLGMAVINSAVLFLGVGPEGERVQGTLFVNPLLGEDVDLLIQTLQINWLQPVYNFTFSNGLIAVLVFMGIGVLLDVGFVMARPFASMTIALFAELGTVVTLPVAYWLGLPLADAAATATIGGADGPMILYAALMLSEELFVPITVVAYLYLGLTYGGYPYLIKAMVPRHIRGMRMPPEKPTEITPAQKLVFCVFACIGLSLLFPVAAPLFFALFIGVVVRESGLVKFAEVLSGPVLYGATFFLGLLLGVLTEANTILNPDVLILLLLGIGALTISGIGGLLGGYVLYFATGRKFNPVIGIAGVSCVPTCAKVAQKTVAEVTPDAVVLPQALGASISGVITSAIFAAIFISLFATVSM